jgi:hypothetical protein
MDYFNISIHLEGRSVGSDWEKGRGGIFPPLVAESKIIWLCSTKAILVPMEKVLKFMDFQLCFLNIWTMR